MQSRLIHFCLSFAIALSGLALTACGGKFSRITNPSGMTTITLQKPRGFTPGQINTQALSGGVMVYAVNADFPDRRGGIKLADENDSVQVTIPTAKYVFLVIGYTAPNFTGTVHCGITAPIHLDGSPKTINLVAASSQCGGPPFMEPGFSLSGQPQVTKIAVCGDVDLAGTLLGAPCSPAGESKDLKITMPEYDAFAGAFPEDLGNQGPADEISTLCISGLTTNDPDSFGGPGLRLISGISSGPNPFAIGIEIFTNSFSCTDSATNRNSHHFIEGIANIFDLTATEHEYNHNPRNPIPTASYWVTDGSVTHMYLNSDFI